MNQTLSIISKLLPTFVVLSGSCKSRFVLPFVQLVRYTEDINSVDRRLSPAIYFPWLETLTMIAITTEIVFPVTTFPCLVTVYVDFPRKVETLGCFDNLTLPAIEYITILYCEGNLMPCLIRVLSNSSSCPLKTLYLRFRDFVVSWTTN